jgi:tetratricopeptide (TPR) repeat protein
MNSGKAAEGNESKEPRSAGRRAWSTAFVWYGLFLLLAVWSGLQNWQKGVPILEAPSCSFSLMWIFYWAMTVPHELGHAFAAKAFGLQDIRIVIGQGAPAFSFRALGFRWLFNRIPLGGFVAFGQAKRPSTREYVLLVLAGPAVSALVMAMLFVLYRREGSWFSLHHVEGIIFWANAALLGWSLIPYETEWESDQKCNDGMLVLRTLFPGRYQRMKAEKRVSPFQTRFLKIILCAILSVAALGLAALAVLVFWAMGRREPGVAPYFLSIFFAGLAIYMGRTAYRVVWEPWVLESSKSGDAERSLTEEGLAELVRLSRATKDKLWAECARALVDGSPMESVRVYGEVLEQFPGDPYVLYLKAYAFHRAQKNDAADATLQILAQQLLPEVAALTVACARLYYLIADDRMPEAEALCGEWERSHAPLAHKNTIVEAMVNYALYLERPNHLEAMESWIRKAIATDSNNFSMQATLGGLLVEMGRFAEAEPLLAHRIESAPSRHNRAYALFYIGLIRAAEGKKAEARDLFERATILSEAEWLGHRVRKKLGEMGQA